ncbi:hypothetical protein DIPPA_04807, partial [Diplonema papillatum]
GVEHISILALFGILVRRRASEWFVEGLVYGYVLVILIWDNTAAIQMQQCYWTMFVLAIDVMLVCRLRRQATINCCIVVIGWLTLTTVVSLLGTSLTVGWNTSRTCRGHFDEALLFTSLAKKQVAAVPPGLHAQHVGICSGSLARVAAGYGTALYVARGGDPVVVKKTRLARPVDRWSVRRAAGSVTVHEVNAALVDETWLAANGVFSEAVDAPWEWSEAYRAAFESREVSAIEAHLLENPLASHTLILVAENLRCKTRVPPCLYV